jgi:aldose 1-epimerase
VDTTLIPLSGEDSVEGTPFDLRRLTRLGDRLDSGHPQLELGRGFDHNFVLRGTPNDSLGALRSIAHLEHPASGRALDVLTTEPGLQVYTGGFLDGSIVGKGGARYERHAGICLEPQHFPDTPNRPDFPSARLDPGQIYKTRTVYRFTRRARSASR